MGHDIDSQIMIVDDDAQALRSFNYTLKSVGFKNVACFQGAKAAWDAFESSPPAVVVLDIVMPELSGEVLLERARARSPDTPVIMVTGVNDVEMAVGCMKKGAFDYLLKPATREGLLQSVGAAMELAALRQENRRLRESLLSDKPARPEAFAKIVAADSKMLAAFKLCEAVAETPCPVLITGETGVGKELFAAAIHQLSRRGGDFVAVNVAGIEENVFTDTLFGHKKGAFTGAVESRKGLVELAAGGTLFLDEVGDLGANAQIKLLRLLQESEYTPLGSDVVRKADARVLLATHRDLEGMLQDGSLRKDLYYRLNTHHLRVPPLRERPGDLPPLVEFFAAEAAKALGKPKPECPPELFQALRGHAFPGNVRELRSMVFDAMSKLVGEVLEPSLFSLPAPAAAPVLAAAAWLAGLPELPAFEEVARALADDASRRSGGDRTAAAAALGLTPRELGKWLPRAELS